MKQPIQKKRITTRITPLLASQIQEQAETLGITQSELIQRSAEAYLENVDSHEKIRELRKENATLHRNVSGLKKNLDAARSEKAEVKSELESVKFDLNRAENDNEKLGRALVDTGDNLCAVLNRGIFRRLFNLKPKQPKPDKHVEAEA